MTCNIVVFTPNDEGAVVFKARTWQRHRRTILAIVIAAVPISLPASARAQGGVGRGYTVTPIANAFFTAVVAGRWNDASRLLDTISLKAIRRQSAEYVRRWRAARPLTLKQFMETNPDVPRAVAAFQVKEANDRTRALGKALSPYGVEDADSLLALPIETYASRWLEIRDERWMLRESARRCGHGAPTNFSIEPYRIIAAVPGDSVAYVLYDAGPGRSPTAYAQEPRVPRVMVLRSRGATWSIVPSDDLVGMGEMVNACG